MPPLVLVMTGGALGAGARYLVGRFVGGAFPWGTLGVNLLGGLLMGLLAGAAARGAVSDSAWLFAGVGALGGFTTFSAFGMDAVTMMQRGAWAHAALYAGASVGGALLLFALGQHLAGGRA